VPSDTNLLKHLLGIRDAEFAGDELGEEGVTQSGKRSGENTVRSYFVDCRAKLVVELP
jgi:hypothetical protein